MDDQLKAAFASATETVKNMLTLATAILTVSITFVKDINKTPTSFQVWVLEASWVSLLLTAVLCLAALAAITGTLATKKPLTGSSLYERNIKWPMTAAVSAFLAGLTLTALFGMMSV